METFFFLLMLANACWFGAGFWLFGIRSSRAAELILPKSVQTDASFTRVAYSLKFLGGMNLAFSVLAILAATRISVFEARAYLLLVFGLAHGSQFGFNAPIAWREYMKRQHHWSVLNGPMLFIFVGDGVLAVLNLSLGILYF